MITTKELKQNYSKINEALIHLGKEYPRCAFASAEGLGSNPDHLHFSAAALVEFGIRYYKTFESLESKAEDNDKPIAVNTERTEIELL